MADEAHHEFEHGSMDISAHVQTWHAFWAGTKWTAIGCIALAVFLFIFRT